MSRERVERIWEGATVACLATGPSLSQEDCDFVRGRARVIAINDAHRLAPWADVLYSSDRHWWPHHKGVPSFQGLKFGVGSGLNKRNPYHGLPEIRVLTNTGYTGLEADPSGLRTGSNSGYAALNLAVHFGAARILLLGYNMGHWNGVAHFFGNHPPHLNQSTHNFPSWRKHFTTLVEPLRALGVEVLNCTENTSLNAFPLADLRQVLPTREVAA